jgi:hypothetical protein
MCGRNHRTVLPSPEWCGNSTAHTLRAVHGYVGVVRMYPAAHARTGEAGKKPNRKATPRQIGSLPEEMAR